MTFAREPRLVPVQIKHLRPTQLTVGLREVAQKREEWRTRAMEDKAEYLGKHLIPVVLGPKGKPYIIDHHHLARALHEEGVEEVATTVVADLSVLEPEAFWIYLDNRAWMHLYNAAGERCDPKRLPKHVSEMADDPYRSLSGVLRRAGGFAKDTTPFSEFLWADYLRRRVTPDLLDSDPDKALADALSLAKGQEAAYLPGWCGPITSE
ncbi:MAG: ParB-like protein [Acidocella sp.]